MDVLTAPDGAYKTAEDEDGITDLDEEVSDLNLENDGEAEAEAEDKDGQHVKHLFLELLWVVQALLLIIWSSSSW